MCSDWGARLAHRDAVAGTRRRDASRPHRREVIASAGSSAPAPTERLPLQPTREAFEPGRAESTCEFRLVATSFASRQARDLQRRLVRWRPAYWPLVVSFLVDLVGVGWYTVPSAGGLGWPLRVLWLWPHLTAPLGIDGVPAAHKARRNYPPRLSRRRVTLCD